MASARANMGTEEIYDALHSRIANLELLPGDKLSEAETAQSFGVSRQPVRDVFRLLESQGLLKIRPQRATRVRGFDMEEIHAARLIRSAIEYEIIRKACVAPVQDLKDEIELVLASQKLTTENRAADEFHKLDYQFHHLLAQRAGCETAFQTASLNKAKVDRLCTLELDETGKLDQLLQDHISIAQAIFDNDPDRAIAAARVHFSRLDETIEKIRAAYPHYFENS
ncbi:GntR family transcriptional regulator [Maritalea porphyrae]|uniref:GntR family transcriptional regulator n=1 Tax=Maritalea porphyrae TaxID=880732 RepID=A0ABQ5USC8_9HYPH|nr:GntR family transcriptional regulator [Maritalea porphyrae]GLQ18183.1 GntR family transcriptional regulator [Maritalea porphyrae]